MLNTKSVFISGGGATGELFRSIDWSQSPLGPKEAWATSLKNTLNTVFHSQHPMYLWWGPELIQFYNDAYLPSLGSGKHPKEMGRRGRDCSPEMWPIIGPQIEGVLQRGEATYHQNQLIPIFRNGSIEDVYWTYGYSPVFDDELLIAGVLVVCTETTHSVNYQKEIQNLSQDLRAALVKNDMFLGMASHELKTPLTTLKLQTEMSQRVLSKQGIAAFSDAKLAKFLKNIMYQTDRLDSLINDMLDVSRINAGKLYMQYAKTNLSQMVTDVMERFSLQLETSENQVVPDFDDNISANVDAFRIEQVLTNFITNAIKYAPGTALHITVKNEGRSVRVSLRDEGAGIPELDQNRIFNRFERAAVDGDTNGLGLGLYISKQIIHAHGGEIYVQSEVGRGAEFGFMLPLVSV